MYRCLKKQSKDWGSSEDSSLSTLGLMSSGPAALEMLRACRSFKTPLSVTLISCMSFSWLCERFVKYLQRAESFMGICWEKTE